MVTRFVQPISVLDFASNDTKAFTEVHVLPVTTANTLQIVVFVLLFLMGLFLLSASGSAQMADMPRGELVKFLGEQYAETPVAIGLSESGGVIEVFAATDGSTWTMIVTTPDGLSRVIQAGEAWIGMTSSRHPARQVSATP